MVEVGVQDPVAATGHPGVRPDSWLTEPVAGRYTADGSWTAQPLRSLLTSAVQRHPDRLAAVSVSKDQAAIRLTFAELDQRVHRLAGGLASLGVQPGDSVVLMLPNTAEFAALIWAVNELGAVYTGIPVAYGEREVEHILRRTAARTCVIPDGFRGADHLGMMRRLRGRLETLRDIVVVNPARALHPGEHDLAGLLAASDRPIPAPDARALCHVGFTSGTTGEPKGVMNTSQTLTAVLRNFVAHVGRDSFGPSVVNLVASPVGHHTGFLWGVLFGAYLDATCVYLDRWDPAHAAAVIEEFGVTTMFGAPTFVQDLLHTDLAGREGPLRLAVVAGAPVPRTLPADASTAFGAFVCPAWGMTEWGIGIACAPSMTREALLTDGLPVGNCEVRVVDHSGQPAPADVEGRLQIRGPGLFLGYLGRPDATREAVDADGWFDTGDNARFLSSGYLELRGRSKDIVIRGGENIPVVEVESLLFAHPDIQDVAVIGIPDPRLGERACAVVVPVPGAQVSLAELCRYLLDRGMSKHFLPERLTLVDALPKTASGKIRKVELRSHYAQVTE
jgi:cyclohexanecarboxylate-CoA ligase